MTRPSNVTATTKAETIATQLKAQILDGRWAPGDRFPARREWAAEFDVSAATITAAIRRLQKEGLLRVIQGKGAFVAEEGEKNTTFRSLIGLTGCYLSNPPGETWHSRVILEGIWQEANQSTHPVVLLPDLAVASGITPAYCRRLGVEGLIFLGGEGYANASLLKEHGFPVILSNKPAHPTTLNYLDYDNVFTIREVVRLFVRAGHQRISVLYAEGTVSNYYQEMKLQFLDELMQHDIVYDPAQYWRNIPSVQSRRFDLPEVTQSVDQMLRLPEPPTAFFCWEPEMVPTLIESLQQRNRSIPRDVSVLASGYADEKSMNCSGFTVPHNELGNTLVQELCRTMENPYHSVQRLLRPSFVERGSIGQLRSQGTKHSLC